MSCGLSHCLLRAIRRGVLPLLLFSRTSAAPAQGEGYQSQESSNNPLQPPTPTRNNNERWAGTHKYNWFDHELMAALYRDQIGNESLQWECEESFPQGPRSTWIKEPGEQLTMHHTTDQQRCEAGNREVGVKTFMYNRGRDDASPGVCGVGGCWCCGRTQASTAYKSMPCSYSNSFNKIPLRRDFANARDEIRRALDVPNGYPSCAIVGSSGRLLGNVHGPAIDDHALVMRMNTAPTVGFEAYAGTRTTHRVVATTGLSELLFDNCGSNGTDGKCAGGSEWCPPSDVILNSFLTDMGRDINLNSPQTRQFRSICGGLGQRIVEMTATQRSLVYHTLTPPGKNFMTGLAGVLLAVLLCDHGVDLYGFDDGTEPQNTSYHFYDDLDGAASDDIQASRDMLASIARSDSACIRIHA